MKNKKKRTAPQRAGTRAVREARVFEMLETLRRRKPAAYRKMLKRLWQIARAENK